MDTALGFRGRYPLHPVSTGFKLQLGIHVIADHPTNDFFKSTVLPFVLTHGFNTPTLAFGVAGIHSEQVTGKNSRFITAGAGADFQKHVTAIERIFRQHQHLQFLLQLLTLGFVD